MEKSDRKRPRQDADDADDTGSSSSPPPYGTKEYWEDRYKRLQTEKSKESSEGDEEQPDPFHAWYFNYEELAPLILPLILGDSEATDDDDSEPPTRLIENVPEEKETGHAAVSNDSNHSKSDEKIEESPTEGVVTRPQGEPSACEEEHDSTSSREGGDSDNADDDDDDEFVEVGDDDDEEDEDEDGPPSRSGLAKDGPIEILEVGCGDVPLGKDIIAGIQELENSKDAIVTEKILKRVICVDYSTIVIEAMISKEKSDSAGKRSVPLEYVCADARKLPYENEQFQFILEKGTMDAMLSDLKTGSDNCRAIMAEMARVVAIGGKNVKESWVEEMLVSVLLTLTTISIAKGVSWSLLI
jgi:hypothetical protein